MVGIGVCVGTKIMNLFLGGKSWQISRKRVWRLLR